LQVLKALRGVGRSLRDILADVPLFPQTMINVRVIPGVNVEAEPSIIQAVAQVEGELGDAGRVLLRPSGTEPVIRVMVEGRDEEQVNRLCHSLAQTVEDLMAAA
jgi:phosphoglucosamine mutase